MDYKPCCTRIAGVTHPPYTKTPPESALERPFFGLEKEKGAFSAKNVSHDQQWITKQTALGYQVLRTRYRAGASGRRTNHTDTVPHQWGLARGRQRMAHERLTTTPTISRHLYALGAGFKRVRGI
jgi:hypothetical protein